MKTYKSTIGRYRIVSEKGHTLPKVQLKSSLDAAKYIRPVYDGEIDVREMFFIILLNRSNNTTRYVQISSGGVSGTVVDMKIILKHCIEGMASSVIAVHNHPSGNIQPSSQDEELTRRLKTALSYMDIKLLDHIIVSEAQYYSFADEGII